MIDEKALSILRTIRDSGSARFTDLSREVCNSRTLSMKLKMLQDQEFVGKVGSSYSLTEKGIAATVALESYMKAVGRGNLFQSFERIPVKPLIPILRKYCELLYSQYRDRLVGVILFGSFARENWHTDSDIDLALVVYGWENSKIWERIKELTPLKIELEHTFEFSDSLKKGFSPSISHLAMSRDDLKRFKTIHLDLAFEGIILYDKSGEMQEFIESVKSQARNNGTRRVMLADGSILWELGQEQG